MAGQSRRQPLEGHLAAGAIQDPSFRERLLQDPKADRRRLKATSAGISVFEVTNCDLK
jgi:hypothetical protein